MRRNRGIVATAMHCVNSVPYVCRAEPGIRTYLDLPLIAGRAAPSSAPCDGRVKELTHPDWVRRMNLFGETTGDPARMVGLDADEMLAVARAVDRSRRPRRGRVARLGGDVPPARSTRSTASRSCTSSAAS